MIGSCLSSTSLVRAKTEGVPGAGRICSKWEGTRLMSQMKRGKLSSLKPDKHNANEGTERGQKVLEDSINRYGAGRSILLDKKGRIIAGNKTHAEAGQLGMENVVIVETDGTELVAVKRMDLDLEKDEKARELAYADNRSAEIGLSWDPVQIMADIKAGIDLPKVGFTHAEVTKILEKGQEALEDAAERHGFTEEVLEEHQYVVLYFDNKMDWQMAQDVFGLETKNALDSREGYERAGIGRVLKGSTILEKLKQ